MERTICSYNEKNARLQLVRVVDDHKNTTFELRLNRRVLDVFNQDLAFEARLVFVHSVHELCVNRNCNVLSKLT